MTTADKKTVITKDVANHQILVTREFDGSPEMVWKAWTDSALLEQWWAPRPWKAVSVSMDFSEGGTWLYYMQGPDGTKSYCKVEFQIIDAMKSFTSIDAFCDEDGNKSTEMPSMHWKVDFAPEDDGTKVLVTITFDSEEEMNKIIEMGFEQGFTMAHGNLDELLANESN